MFLWAVALNLELRERLCLFDLRFHYKNSFIKKEDETGDEQHNYDHGHDMITMERTRK